jgi:uncharacterized protein (TIGR00251 family)
MTKSGKDIVCVIDVRVVPRASRTEIVGMIGNALKVRLAAPPVDGAANAELQRLIAKAFDVSRSSVEIVAGEASKLKRLRIHGVSQADLDRILSGKS